MNAKILIDLLVQQTTVLIAEVATAAGLRAPLADVADQVFASLVTALEGQGLRQKVIADMFGMALRTYQRRASQVTEGVDAGGNTLWSAVLSYVQARPGVSRSELLQRFRRDDEAVLKGVLIDLVDSGLLYRSGRGPTTVYRSANDLDPLLGNTEASSGMLQALVQVVVFRHQPTTNEALGERLRAVQQSVDDAVEDLLERGAIQRNDDGMLVCDQCTISVDQVTGWPAAVFDHYQAAVTAILQRVRGDVPETPPTGGSTYTFHLWPGHPVHDDVMQLFERTRAAADAARAACKAYEADPSTVVPKDADEVVFYVGQSFKADP